MFVWKHVKIHNSEMADLAKDWFVLVQIRDNDICFTVAQFLLGSSLAGNLDFTSIELTFKPKSVSVDEIYEQIELAPGLTQSERESFAPTKAKMVRIYHGRKFNLARYLFFENPADAGEMKLRSRQIFDWRSINRRHREVVADFDARDQICYDEESLNELVRVEFPECYVIVRS